MATSDSPNSDGPSRAGTEPDAERAWRTAIGLLSHRLNGGLNNAMMAFELAAAPFAPGRVPLVSILRGGLAGAERASRAANLLDVLVGASEPAKRSDGEYLSDVFELLREEASRSGCALACAPDMTPLAEVSSTAEDAALSLVAGLAAIPRAGRGRLCLRLVQGKGGPWFDLDAESAHVAKPLWVSWRSSMASTTRRRRRLPPRCGIRRARAH